MEFTPALEFTFSSQPSDDMEALVEHREKLDAELEQLRENRMELEAEIEGKENALNIIDKIIEETEVSY